MKIICINGQGGVGKDTFVEFCGNPQSGVYNFSMIKSIKDLATHIGWRGEKRTKDRKFLSDLKDLVAEYNDYPFKSVLTQIDHAISRYEWRKEHINFTDELICFIHSRGSEDIQRWRQDYGAKALLIRREEIEGDYGNHADDGVFDINYDYIIHNNKDVFCLKKEAEYFIKKIREEKWESNIWK